MALSKNSGRDYFHRWKRVIIFISIAISVFPKGLRIFMFELFSSSPGMLGVVLRYIIIYKLVKSCGDNIYIARWCVFKNMHNISIGNNVSFHERGYIDGVGGVNIGNDVSLAHSVSIVSFEHNYKKKEVAFKYQAIRPVRISISSNVWVGCGSRILAGCSIDSNVVVAANSVTKGHLVSGVYAGAPAIKVKDII